jgi:hypothetical protein
MSQQVFSKARSHFDHTPFEAMFREVTEEQYRGEYDLEHWKGYQILAVDGSEIAFELAPKTASST